jgi:CopG family nickel-responsive transcriptional regulator
MTSTDRIGVSISDGLLKAFDKIIRQKGYASRSEAIRDIIRDFLVEQEWVAGKKEVVGTVTIVYDHHSRELGNRLTELQHRHHTAIISSTHVHLDEHNCLEVIIVRAKPEEVKRIADQLISTKGVKHGKLVATSSGRGIE